MDMFKPKDECMKLLEHQFKARRDRDLAYWLTVRLADKLYKPKEKATMKFQLLLGLTNGKFFFLSSIMMMLMSDEMN